MERAAEHRRILWIFNTGENNPETSWPMHIVQVKKPRPERTAALAAVLAGVISISLPFQPVTAREGVAEVASHPAR